VRSGSSVGALLRHAALMAAPIFQATSSGESVSTLAFGSRVSAITLGRATRSCESSAIFESRQAAQLCVSPLPALLMHWAALTAPRVLLRCLIPCVAPVLFYDGIIPGRSPVRPAAPTPLLP